MGLLDKIKNALKEPTKDDLKEVELNIYSASYYQPEIEKLVSKIMPINNRYIMETPSTRNMMVWKYDPCMVKHVKFEKDPKNEHDPNAIKIMAGSNLLDMVLIGYVPREDNKKFKKWMDEGKIYNVNLVIVGGDNKAVAENCTIKDSTNYKVTLRLLVLR